MEYKLYSYHNNDVKVQRNGLDFMNIKRKLYRNGKLVSKMYVNDTIAFECYLRKGLFGTKLEILFQDMERPIEIVRTDGVFYLLVDKYTFHFEAKWFGKSRYIFYKDFERIGENPSWGFFSSQDYPQLYSLNFYDENEYIYYFILFFAVLLEVSMG